MRFSVLILALVVSVLANAQTRDTTYFIYENLGPNVNSEYNDSGPRISPDGKSLYFFRIDHPEDLKGSNDIWVSHLQEGDSTWSVAERLGEPLNNYADNAVHSVSVDGKSLLVHDIYLKNKMSKSGVSITNQKEDGTWSFPKELKIKKYKNTNEICAFYLSDDWETLILAIETPTTLGKQDLYVSFHDKKKDTWSEPLDLGATINSAGGEATAFLAEDQKTLYFSTDGRSDTYGGFDIYKSVRQDSTWTNWSEPENLGSPYNTADDEFYFSIPSHAGGWAYLAHSHAHGHSDITRVKKVTEPLPDPTALVMGLLYDDSTKKTIAGDVEFFIMPANQLVGVAKSDTATEYVMSLAGYSKYEYRIKLKGYKEFVGEIDLTNLAKDVDLRKDIYLTPIPEPVVAVAITLKNVEFETGKWDILPQFEAELQKFVDILKTYPEHKYIIEGHTDSVGKDAANQTLSENRAKAVLDYVVAKGADASRLEAKGYGEKKPVATNDTAEGRQRNRRVDLVRK